MLSFKNALDLVTSRMCRRGVSQIIALAVTLAFSHSAGAQAQLPAGPTTLNATTHSKNQINLAWDDPNPTLSGFPDAGYIGERAKLTPTSWSNALTSAANQTSW